MDRDLGTTVLISGHNLTTINDICDRILRAPSAGESAIKTCPHGRPVSAVLTHKELDKMFKRIV